MEEISQASLERFLKGKEKVRGARKAKTAERGSHGSCHGFVVMWRSSSILLRESRPSRTADQSHEFQPLRFG